MNFEEQQRLDELVKLASTPGSNQNKHRHAMYAWVGDLIESKMQFDPERQIGIIWHYEDVQSLDETLTDEEAFEVLKAFEKHHEGSMEQMWLDLQYHLDEWKRNR